MPTSTHTTQAQINALLSGAKTHAERDFTDLHRLSQAGPHLTGIRKSYQPYDEDGETLPPETNYPQVVVEDLFARVVQVLDRWFGLQFTQDRTNCEARADVVVDGQVLLPDVPATFLLFLEKRLIDLRTFVRKAARLDETERWAVDQDARAGWYQSEPASTVRTKKLIRPFVKWEPPTPEFKQDAQVDLVTEDARIGTYTTVKLSGAVPGARLRHLEDRVDQLVDAVKLARERANSTTAVDRTARPLLDFLFA